jgi:hypothetical protein
MYAKRPRFAPYPLRKRVNRMIYLREISEWLFEFLQCTQSVAPLPSEKREVNRTVYLPRSQERRLGIVRRTLNVPLAHEEDRP